MHMHLFQRNMSSSKRYVPLSDSHVFRPETHAFPQRQIWLSHIHMHLSWRRDELTDARASGRAGARGGSGKQVGRGGRTSRRARRRVYSISCFLVLLGLVHGRVFIFNTMSSFHFRWSFILYLGSCFKVYWFLLFTNSSCIAPAMIPNKPHIYIYV